MQTDEPAVLVWMAATAPRPLARVSAPGHHWWREYVVGVWRDATDAWEAQLEAASNGWATEAREFEEQHPRPRLADFMRGLSIGAYDLEQEPA